MIWRNLSPNHVNLRSALRWPIWLCVLAFNLNVARAADLAFRVLLDDTCFVPGRPIAINMELLNRGPAEATVPFQGITLEYSVLDYRLRRQDGSLVPTLVPEFLHFRPSPPTVLQAGEAVTGVFDLNTLVRPPQRKQHPYLLPGSYSLSVTLNLPTDSTSSNRLVDSVGFIVQQGTTADSLALQFLHRAWRRILDFPGRVAALDSLLQLCPASPLREGALVDLCEDYGSRDDERSKSALLRTVTAFTLAYPNSPFIWSIVGRVCKQFPEGEWRALRDTTLARAPDSRAARAFHGLSYPVALPDSGKGR